MVLDENLWDYPEKYKENVFNSYNDFLQEKNPQSYEGYKVHNKIIILNENLCFKSSIPEFCK